MPAIALIVIIVAVVVMIVIGSLGRWFLALLVPVVVFTAYVAVRVVLTMVREMREGMRPPETE